MERTIYHGSHLVAETPEIRIQKYNKDFYFGFYCTTIPEQAIRRATRFGGEGILNKYRYTPNESLNVKVFPDMTEEWLDFILNCRSGKDRTAYDLVIGGVANDKVFNTVELFFERLIDKAEAISRLRYEKPNLQICFRTEKALGLLHFEGSELV